MSPRATTALYVAPPARRPQLVCKVKDCPRPEYLEGQCKRHHDLQLYLEESRAIRRRLEHQ